MQESVWTLKRMLDWMEGYLAAHGDEQPRLSAQLLVCHATNLTRTQLFLDMLRPLDASELDWLRSAVKRRAAGEPIQYITSVAPFRFLEIKTAPGVLIPRPETEVLVSEVLARLPKAPRRQAMDSQINEYGELIANQAQDSFAEGEGNGFVLTNRLEATPSAEFNVGQLLVADLCTGSGCIACSLAYENSLISVEATDISVTACNLAKENVSALNLEEKVHVYECSLGEAISDELIGHLDAVVSNPPYIPSEVLKGLPREVADYEPELALDGGQDGLDLFREIALWAQSALKPGGFLAVELHETTLDAAKQFATSLDYIDATIIKDLTSKPRVLICYKQH
jgi:release factor glutamine methyltransferase